MTNDSKTYQTFRRGVVLQGGGAKGAFQFGVLRELHDAGQLVISSQCAY